MTCRSHRWDESGKRGAVWVAKLVVIAHVACFLQIIQNYIFEYFTLLVNDQWK